MRSRPRRSFTFVFLVIGCITLVLSEDCDANASSDLQGLQDVLLLQVDHNLTATAKQESTEKELNSEVAKPRSEPVEQVKRQNVAPWTEPPALMALSTRVHALSRLASASGTTSASSALLLAFQIWLGVCLVILIGLCIAGGMGWRPTRNTSEAKAPATERLLASSSQATPGATSTYKASARRAEPVPPPILCRELVLDKSETRFSVDFQAFSDTHKNGFTITSPAGTPLLEADIHDAITLTLKSLREGRPYVMCRGVLRQAGVKPMLSIMDERGAFFGKVAEAPTGKGLALYHRDRPSCMIACSDMERIDLKAIPIIGGGKTSIANCFLDGQNLQMQARAGTDATLFAAIFCSMIAIEPVLLEMARQSEI